MEAGTKPQAGTPIMGVDSSGQAQFMRSDANGNVSNSPIPAGATSITASSGNVAAGSAVATLAAAAGKTTYITGFQITSSGSTSALVVTATVANVITGTMSYTYTTVAGVTLANAQLLVSFPIPIPANAAATTIVVTLPTLGSGNTNTTVSAQGYQL